MNAFELNEGLKEKLIQEYKAIKAVSVLYPFGITFMPERFLETTVHWNKDIDTDNIENALKEVEESVKTFNKYTYFDGPIYQESSNGPTIVWALFDKESNLEKGIDHLSPNHS